ncbi:MAG: diaminopimelate decarboxylase [Bdellovibrionaceae bacterium]|nr:diaminopimelate decarboxylase [Pseudobdellovibrionaceae bacterium]
MRKTNFSYIDDSLCFGEKSIRLADFAKASGPVYLYDLALIRSRFLEMQQAFPGAKLYYAMKANSHPDVMRTLKAAGAGADVVSGGEICRALESGFEPGDIVYSGVGKTEKEIREALTLGIFQINVESVPELERIGRLGREMKKKARVALRLNPDVSIQTHPYIATGLAENKFGMELKEVPRLTEILKTSSDSLELVGVSLHLGSQMLEFGGLEEALRLLKPVYRELAAQFPTLKKFDAGGGLGILYHEDDLVKESEALRVYAKVIRDELADLGAELQLEPGRWLVGHAGVLLTQVQYVKQTSHRCFVIVDSGMNHLIRPALYEAHHRLLPLQKNPQAPLKKVDVVGPICESADFFAKERELPELKEGEWLAVADTGAYGFSMANVYNLQDLPTEIPIS